MSENMERDQKAPNDELQEIRRMLIALQMKLDALTLAPPAPSPAAPTVEVPQPKRRGRPPKITPSPTQETPKRPRGRPPKVSVSAPVQPTNLRAHLQQLLSTDPLKYSQLTKMSGVPLPKLIPVMQELKSEGLVYNITIEDDPRWVWRVGDTNPSVSRHLAQQIIGWTPQSRSSLAHILRSSISKTEGYLIDLRRLHGDRIVDYRPPGDTSGERVFYLLPEHKLGMAPKKTKKTG